MVNVVYTANFIRDARKYSVSNEADYIRRYFFQEYLHACPNAHHIIYRLHCEQVGLPKKIYDTADNR